MDSVFFEVGFLSIVIIVLLGGLVLFMIYSRKGKGNKEDYSTKITGYESLYKKGKLSKEEYNQIKIALMRQQGIEIPPELLQKSTSPRPVRSSMNNDETKDDSTDLEQNKENKSEKGV